MVSRGVLGKNIRRYRGLESLSAEAAITAFLRMSWLPDSASFEELVQDCFLTYRACGLDLSPVDAEVVREWAMRGVPIEVVAKGIRRSAERALWDAIPGEPPIRSLRHCRVQVDSEIRKHLALTVGRGLKDEKVRKRKSSTAPLGRFRTALRKAARRRPELGAALHRALNSAEASSTTPPLQREERLYLQLIRALPFGERLALLREASGLTSASFGGSREARRRARRFVRGALIRKRLALPGFW